MCSYKACIGRDSEYGKVPVVCIVGYPPVAGINKHAIMHHSLGDGRFDEFHQMVKHITVADTVIKDPGSATSEIDRCLNEMMLKSQPM